jgi:hypothetical protein
LLAPLLSTGCATTVLPPPPAPPETLPVIAGDATPAPAAGFTRVRLTTDVPARVYLRADALGGTRKYGPREIRTLVCETTPCAFVVPFGDHELETTGSESKELNEMGESTSYAERTARTVLHAHAPEVVLNETLGWQHTPAGRVAGASMIVLGMVVAIGAADVAKGTGNSSSSAAGGLAVAGLGSIVLGGILLAAVPSVEQPASTREWTPKPTATAGASLGFRF